MRKIKNFIIVYKFRPLGAPTYICEGEIREVKQKNGIVRLVIE